MGGVHAKHGSSDTRQMRRVARAVVLVLALLTLGAVLWPT